MAKEQVKDENLGECLEKTCREKATRLTFCPEHFDQFKFGCIKRNGLRPTDYEKKMDHYLKNKSVQR